MFPSVIKKRSIALAAPLLLFSIACASEESATPTPVAPTATPTSVAPVNTPTPTAALHTPTPIPTPTLLHELVAARAAATAAAPADTPTPTAASHTPISTPAPAATLTLQDQVLHELVVLRENLYATATAIALTPIVVPPTKGGNQVGDIAHDFTLTEVSTGQSVRLAELTEQGRPVIVYFFTTW